MSAEAKTMPEPEDQLSEKEPLPFGQNLLGITFLADDWEKDIPPEYFLGEGEENLFGGGNAMATAQVNLYEAKTQLSALVDRAAKGEEIVIAKAGKPMAKLVPFADNDDSAKPLRKFGQNLLGITFLSDDWEKDIPLSYFKDEGEENPFGDEPATAEPQ
jgi:prevent-host-death family protein